MLEWKDQKKKTVDKYDYTTWRDKSKEEIMQKKKHKIYWDRVEQYKQNRTIQNNERKFYHLVGGECMRTNRQLDAKEIKQFWSKIWEQKEHNKKAEWINNMKKELQGAEEGPKPDIYLESLGVTRKKVLNWKILGHDGIHRF